MGYDVSNVSDKWKIVSGLLPMVEHDPDKVGGNKQGPGNDMSETSE